MERPKMPDIPSKTDIEYFLEITRDLARRGRFRPKISSCERKKYPLGDAVITAVSYVNELSPRLPLCQITVEGSWLIREYDGEKTPLLKVGCFDIDGSASVKVVLAEVNPKSSKDHSFSFFDRAVGIAGKTITLQDKDIQDIKGTELKTVLRTLNNVASTMRSK